MAKTRPPEELYDLENDPFEIHNLTTETKYEEVLQEMQKKLDDWLFIYDKGTYSEDADEIAYWQEQQKINFRKRMEARGLSPDISDEAYLEYWTQYLHPTVKE